MRDMIAYMNARRAAKPASGGAKQNHSTRYAPDCEIEAGEIAFHKAMSHISDFALWAEASRQALIRKLSIPQSETVDEIPF